MSSYMIKQFPSLINEGGGTRSQAGGERLYLLPAASGILSKPRRGRISKGIVCIAAIALFLALWTVEATAEEAAVYISSQVVESEQGGLCLQPVTGVVRDNYATGAVKRETPYKDGRRHGLERRWYSDATLMSESAYDTGRLHGVTRVYYSNGTLMSEIMYERGQVRSMYKQFYKIGIILMPEKTYLEVLEQELEHGTQKSGIMAEEIPDIARKKHGIQRRWSNGLLLPEAPFACGTRGGACMPH